MTTATARRCLLAAAGVAVGATGGAAAGATSTSTSAPVAGIGGLAGAVLGMAAGILVNAAMARAEARRRAVARRDLMGVVLPAPRLDGDRTAPSWLLAADNQVAPFRGRMDELDFLRAWCAVDEAPLLVLSGAPGSGKTRLTIELAARGGTGWTFLRVGGRATEPQTLVEVLRATGEPTVVVVDLKHDPVAASFSAGKPWLATLLEHRARVSAPLKVIVECRGTAWYDMLRVSLREQVGLLDRTEVLPLDQTGNENDTLRWLNEGRDGVAVETGRDRPRELVHGPPAGTAMLAIHAEAVAGVFGGPAVPRQRSSDERHASTRRVGRYLLDLERATWTLGDGDAGHDDALVRRAVCFVTLLGAGDEDAAAQVLARVPDLAGSTEERRRTLARQTRRFYPGRVRGDWVGALEPDLVAHALHDAVLRDEDTTSQLLAGGLSVAQTNRVLRALVPALAAFPGLLPAVLRIVAASPLHVIPDVVAIACYDDAAVADRLLSEHVTQVRPAPSELDAVARLVPERFVRTLAAICSVRVHHARQGHDLAALADALVSYSDALHDAGRFPDAWRAAEEGVHLLHGLSVSDPSPHRPALASALQSLVAALDFVEQVGDSLLAGWEAVEIWRELAAEDPTHRPSFAFAVRGLAIAQSKVGRDDEAMESEKTALLEFRALAAQSPTTYDIELARTLRTLGIASDRIGQYDEALAATTESVVLLRTAVTRMYLIDFARGLGDLAPALRGLTRYDEALAADIEAVEVLRDMARRDPGMHRGDLANALASLSVALDRKGRYTEALAINEERVVLCRDLVAEAPSVRFGQLAGALEGYAVSLGHAGRHAEAHAVADEAIEMVRPLARDRSSVYAAQLAHVLGIRAGCLQRQGRREEALRDRREAVACLEIAARLGPERYGVLLADEQSRLRSLLRAMGRGVEEMTLGLIAHAPETRSGDDARS